MGWDLTWIIELWWNTYKCSVIDWIRYIEWKNIDEFIDKLIEKWEYRIISEAVWLWNEINKSKI